MDNLVAALEAAGHRAELVRLPTVWDRTRIFDAALAWRMVPVDADLVIATNFPSYFVRHPRKVVWLVPPAPGRVRRRRRTVVRLRARRRLARGAAPPHRLGHPRARRGRASSSPPPGSWPRGWRASTGSPPSRSTTRRRCSTRCTRVRSATTSSARRGSKATSGPELMVEALAHSTSGTRIVIAGRGSRHDDARRERAAARGDRPARPARVRLRRRARPALRGGARASSTRRSTRTTATSRCRRSAPASP